MERMTPLDAAFVEAEDEDRHASLAIAAVAVLQGPAPAQADILTAIDNKLPLVPRYRQRLRTVPFDLGRPVWVDDPDFDLRYHVRRTALPAPGDDAALTALVARLMSQRLDRDRPLWECWVVEGLARGRWAMVSKVHHCMVDGIGAANLHQAMFDHTPKPSGTLPDGWRPEPVPSTLRLTLDAARDLLASPAEQLRLVTQALSNPAQTVRRLAETTRGLVTLVGAATSSPTPSSLVGPIGQQRRYAVGRARLAVVRRVCRHFRASLNDVVLAATAGGYRRLLIGRGEEPDAQAIRALVPVSVRPPGEHGMAQNRISLMLPFLPVHLADPVDRLRAVHAVMAELKDSKEAEAGEAMTTLATHEPFLPVSWGIRLAAHLRQRTIVTVATNVPGPRKPLYLLGRRILEIFPYVPIAVRLRTGVSVLTYRDRLTVGVTADYASAPEAELLARAIESGIAELAAACPEPTGSFGPGSSGLRH